LCCDYKGSLGVSKPPKKKLGANKDPESVSDAARPLAIVCKKKAGACKHEIVFGEHFDKKAWNVFAESVRRKKSTVEIDPDYVC
jgi:hypothetical protein